jgi:integrase
MSPRRSSSGDLLFDRVFTGIGRIQKSSGTRKLKEFHHRDALLTRLYRKPRHDLLRAFRDDQLTIQELVEADRLEKLEQTAAELVAQRLLWPTVDALLPRMGRGAATRRRYQYSLEKLAASGALAKGARVADLAAVDWLELRDRWGGSPADWNHLRRALSHFLTVALGDVYHPLRREIVKAIPKRRERHRVPDVTPEAFRRIVSSAPAPMRPAYWTIALTGARLGELLGLTPADLLETQLEVRIRASKTDTEAGDRLVPVAARLWGWVAAAVPCPFTPDALRWHWYQACKRAGHAPVRLHDLRHLTGQLLADAGRSTAAIGRLLGHAAGSAMTGRYTDRKLRREDAEALAGALVPPTVPPTVRKGLRRG